MKKPPLAMAGQEWLFNLFIYIWLRHHPPASAVVPTPFDGHLDLKEARLVHFSRNTRPVPYKHHGKLLALLIEEQDGLWVIVRE